MGPLLFPIYINDLEEDIKSQINFFSDHTSLFIIVVDPTLSASEHNHNLKKIESLSFNPNPSKQAIELFFSRKKRTIADPPLYFNNVAVASVPYHKHVGVISDSKLSFIKHITKKISTARKRIKKKE